MLCPVCQTPNPDDGRFCSQCAEPLLAKTGASRPGSAGSLAATTAGGITGSGIRSGSLPPGHLLGDRYRIEAALGMGGMGMVYRAIDCELNVPVALKLIRGEYADNPQIVERFKKEITIARRVTHRNVARIYDMGEAEGFRYISMEYIEGRDLAGLVAEKGRFGVEETLSMLRQVCAALKEAHASGVVHRDLKPHNIMLDASGGAHVMDFGIAMAADAGGMTRTGALVGTPEYMSPEQAEGRRVDHRSDIYSLGITLYEILAGDAPFKGDTTWEVIRKQVTQRPQSIRRLRKDVPEWLDTLILKCLEKDPALRYQSVGEILNDLDRQKARLSPRHYLPSRRSVLLGAAALVLVAAAVGVTMYLGPRTPVAGEDGRRSVAILPFQNQTGRADLDWLRTGLADNLTTDLAESRYFRVLSRERLTQILGQLGLDDVSRLDAAALQKIGEFGAVEAIITGSFLSAGDEIRVNLRLQDPATGEIFRSASVNGRESQVLGMIDGLTRTTKQMFQLAPERLAGDSDLDLASARTSVVEAASAFQRGVDLLYQGRNLEAIGPLEAAVSADPRFAMAHARLAEAHMRTGHDSEALQESQAAMDRMLAEAEKIPQADRTFIRALHGRISNRPEESIRAYEELLAGDPGDSFVSFSLGEVIEGTGDFPAAEKRFEDAIAGDRKNPVLHFALGRVRIKAGRDEEALPELQKALELYGQMGSEEGQGNTLNAMALANEDIGRYQEALDYYGRSEAIKRRIGDKRGLASTLNNKAFLLQIQGHLKDATRITDEALALTREIGDTDHTAAILANLGSLEDEGGDPERAASYYTEALELRRTLKDRAGQVTCLIGMNRADAAMGRLAQAEERLDEAGRIAREIDDRESQAQIVSERARIAWLRGDLPAARAGQLDAVARWQEVERSDGVAEARQRLAFVEASAGLHGSARRSALEALSTYVDLEDRTNQARLNLLLARLSLADGDPAGALKKEGEASDALALLDNPVLSAQAALTRCRALLARDDAAGAREAAEEVCAAAKRTPAVLASIQCGLARSLTGSASDAVSQALTASTRAADNGLALLHVEADLALASAYLRAGEASQASTRARLAMEEASKRGLPLPQLEAAPMVARAQWGAGRRDEAVRTLQAAFTALEPTEADLEPAALAAFRAGARYHAAAALLAGYLKELGRDAEAATISRRAGL